jgi:solute carrier family 25 phosphate transporter 3
MASQLFGKTTLRNPTEQKPTGVDLYARFALAGALGCAITHGALTPVDVVSILFILYYFSS